jgi:predicted aspartyl protease
MVRGSHHAAKQGVPQVGVVEGREVGDILLDTGCSRTLVREDLVPAKKFLAGEAVAIRCAHGDTVLYPLAEVEIEVGGQSLKVEVAVLGTLPIAVLLGTDVPELAELLGGSQRKCGGRRLWTDDALVVTTRAQAKQQREEGMIVQQRVQESGV